MENKQITIYDLLPLLRKGGSRWTLMVLGFGTD